MDFSFSEEQTLLRNTIQSFLQDNYDFDSRKAIIQSEDGMSKENWQQLAELGLLGVPFSEADGGLDFGPVETMIVAEEFGKGLVIEPYIQTVVTCGGFLRRGSEEQIPSGRIPGKWGLWIAWAMSALSLLVGYQLGPWGFAATIFGVLAAWAYSAEPLRLKTSGWWGPGLVGLCYEGLPWFTGAAVLSAGAPDCVPNSLS